MKILLTGKKGQVGFELQRALAPLGTVLSLGRAELDLADPGAIRRVIQEFQPEIIVNPAAYTAVDRAESDSAVAMRVNASACEALGEEAAAAGALIVHYSTDYVFDGRKPDAYVEDDVPNPQNVYGRSKLAGEQALARSGAAYLVFRTSWVFGSQGANFAKTMLRLAGDRDELRVVADQWGAPTSAALIADVTAHVIRQYQRESRATFPLGIYHLAAGGVTSWYEYAKVVIAAAHAAGVALKLRPDAIKPIPTSEYPTPAKRPENSRLDTGRLRRNFGLTLPPWQVGLAHVLQQLL